MVCVPFLEGAGCNTDVFFRISANICNFGFVNYIGCQALVVQWAFIFFRQLQPLLLLVSFSFQGGDGYDCVLHARVAHFDVISIEYLMQTG